MKAHEFNFDGLIGPTHNFSGLAFGNIAAQANRFQPSNPKAAARQGLAKMKLLNALGIPQGLLPPQERPSVLALRQFGFTGNDQQLIEKASRSQPDLFIACCSASSMWTANAATVSPSPDTADGRVHITPANLSTHRHRAIERIETVPILKTIFFNEDYFVHHPPLDEQEASDEGAANHMRLAVQHGEPGMEVFVYGKAGAEESAPQRYPARQSLVASRAIAKGHQLAEKTTVFLCQNPEAIDEGVFHNDVIAVSHENVLLMHTGAYLNSREAMKEMKEKFKRTSSQELSVIKLNDDQITVAEAVRSYLFNSQIVTLPDQGMALIAPEECRKHNNLIDTLIAADNPIREVHYVNLDQSMKNGGGPACLRLRVVLKEEELSGMHAGFLLNNERFSQLEAWIDKRYREHLKMDDLRDYQLLKEARTALDELTQILGCGSIYAFQQ